MRRHVLLIAPWTRAPWLGLQQPLAVIGVAIAAAVTALVTTASPLFVGSVGTGGLHQAVDNRCTQDDQISVINPALNVYLPVVADDQPHSAVAAADPVIRDGFASQDMPDPVLTSYTVTGTGDVSGQRPTSLGLFASPDALEHIDLLSSADIPGVYVTDTLAEQFNLQPGDRLPTAIGDVDVAGVYADLDTASYRTVLPDYWCHWRSRIVTSASSRPPPFVIAAPATVAALGTDVEAEWTSPVDITGLTLAQAHALADAGQRLFTSDELDQQATSPVAGYAIATQLDFDLSQAERIKTAVTGPMVWISAAGAVLGMVLIAGAVLFWSRRREAELRLLRSRGVSPSALGAKAVAELAIPAAIGCVAGWAAALHIVPLVGPSPLLDDGVNTRALVVAAGVWALALVVVGIVGSVVNSEVRGRPKLGRGRLGLVAAVAVVAPLAAAAVLVARADPSEEAVGGAYRIDPALLLGPVLGVTGMVLAAALAAAVFLHALRHGAGRWSLPLFLALHRTVASRGPLLAVVCGLALPLALAAYSGGFVDSQARIIEQKAHTYTGAPTTLALRVQLGGIPDVDGATPVSYASGSVAAWRQADLQVLAIDPASFARYAYTDVTGDPGAIDAAITSLAGTPADGLTPALLVGAGDRTDPTEVKLRSSTLNVAVIDHFDAFPGMREPFTPTLVISLQATDGLDRFAGWRNELWTDQAAVGEVSSSLSAAGVLTDEVADPDQFVAGTSLLSVSWTFDFLRFVAALVTSLSLAGLLLFLSARQAGQDVSYVMSRRMGMTTKTFIASLLAELGAVSVYAWISGAAGGCVALWVASRTIDIKPGFPPDTHMVIPAGTLAAGAAALIAVALIATLWTQVRASRVNPAEVLRR